MRGDQVARQWRIIRAIEASPNGLTMAEFGNLSPDLETFQSHCHAKARRAPFLVSLLNLIEIQMKKTFLRVLSPWCEMVGPFHGHSFKVMHDELYTVKVKISPGWARWVAEKIWHENQKARKNVDGTLELTFQVAGLDEIKP